MPNNTQNQNKTVIDLTDEENPLFNGKEWDKSNLVHEEDSPDDFIEILTPFKRQSDLFFSSDDYSNQLASNQNIVGFHFRKDTPKNLYSLINSFDINANQNAVLEKRNSSNNSELVDLGEFNDESTEEVRMTTPQTLLKSNRIVKKTLDLVISNLLENNNSINNNGRNDIKKKLDFSDNEPLIIDKIDRIDLCLIDKDHFSTGEGIPNLDFIFKDIRSSKKLGDSNEWTFELKYYEKVIKYLKLYNLEYSPIPSHILKYIKLKEKDVKGS